MIDPVPLDDNIWDAIMALAKLKIRMQKNGLHAGLASQNPVAYIDKVIREMSTWLIE